MKKSLLSVPKKSAPPHPFAHKFLYNCAISTLDTNSAAPQKTMAPAKPKVNGEMMTATPQPPSGYLNICHNSTTLCVYSVTRFPSAKTAKPKVRAERNSSMGKHGTRVSLMARKTGEAETKQTGGSRMTTTYRDTPFAFSTWPKRLSSLAPPHLRDFTL